MSLHYYMVFIWLQEQKTWRETGATEMESSDASKKSMPTENVLQNHWYDSFPQLAKNANYSSSRS